MFLTPSSTPCWTIERSPKIKKRAPRCMGTLRQKTERAPRCMGTLFVFSWSSWVPPRAPLAIAPNLHFQTILLRILFFGIHLVAAPGVVMPGGAPRRGTDVRRNGGRRPDRPGNAPRKKIRRSATTPSLRFTNSVLACMCFVHV